MRILLLILLLGCTVNCEQNSDNTENEVNEPPAKEVEEETAPGLNCYICNSEVHDFCDDPIVPESKVYLQNCAEHYMARLKSGEEKGNLPPLDKQPQFYCKKQETSFEFPGKMSERRVSRSCGFEEGRYGRQDCTYSANNYYTTLSCKCEGNECNSASSISISAFVILLIASFIIKF